MRLNNGDIQNASSEDEKLKTNTSYRCMYERPRQLVFDASWGRNYALEQASPVSGNNDTVPHMQNLLPLFPTAFLSEVATHRSEISLNNWFVNTDVGTATDAAHTNNNRFPVHVCRVVFRVTITVHVMCMHSVVSISKMTGVSSTIQDVSFYSILNHKNVRVTRWKSKFSEAE